MDQSTERKQKTLTITSGDKEYTVEYTITKKEAAAEVAPAPKTVVRANSMPAENLAKKQPLNRSATTGAESPFDGAAVTAAKPPFDGAAVTAAKPPFDGAEAFTAAGVLKRTGKDFPNMNNETSLGNTAAELAESLRGGRPTPHPSLAETVHRKTCKIRWARAKISSCGGKQEIGRRAAVLVGLEKKM